MGEVGRTMTSGVKHVHHRFIETPQKHARTRRTPTMKMQLLFIRRKTKRKPAAAHMPVNDWTVRDWADLPTHHPKRN
jgi:hypothetical protein